MKRCGLCNQPLQDRESLELGYGPDCWQRLSAAALAPGASTSPAGGAGGPARPVGVDPLVRRSSLPARGRGCAPAAAPTAGSRPHPPDAPHRSVRGPLVACLGWLAIAAALLVLSEYWRWLVLGVVVLALAALVGVLVEWRQVRQLDRHAARIAWARPAHVAARTLSDDV